MKSALSLVQEFSNHDNVIQLLNVIKAHNDVDIYLVFEFMDTDLHAVIKAKILQPVHVQYIMYQVRRKLGGGGGVWGGCFGLIQQ